MSCRVFVTHPNAIDVSFIEDALRLDETDKKRYDLVWDAKEPDVLFASEVIFYDAKMWGVFKSLYDRAGICVFFPGECIAPDLNIFDYGISFSGYDGKNDRIARIPLRKFFGDYLCGRLDNPIKTRKDAYELLKRKKGFCNFIYSNPKGHANRKALFDLLSEYRRVDSYGAFLNNMGLGKSGGSDITMLVRNSTDIKSDYKFTIASENAMFPGYTSEKLYTSLEAGTVPIYWGNPEVALEVNPACFINCHDYDSFEAVLEKVKEVDSDDNLWCEMISQPWLTQEQVKREADEWERLHVFLDEIFSVNKPAERRRPEGTWPEVYQNFWLAKDSGSDKYHTYFNICSSFCRMLQSGRHIYEALEPEIDSVVIYGMGDIGRILYDDFKLSPQLHIPYCIDNRTAVDGLDTECIGLADLSNRERPDAVIVTVTGDFDAIKNSILNVFDAKVISVLELLR